MTNAWNVVETNEQLVKLGTADPDWDERERCPERLAGDRCLLKAGHEGNHQADRRPEDQR